MSNPFKDLEFAQVIRGFVAGQRVFERYTLRGILGRGRMGLVWLAWDEQLEEERALKFLPEIVSLNDSSIQGLKRETLKCQALMHTNIMRICDFVEDAGSAAIAMEYVDGATLTAWRLVQPTRIFKPPDIMPWAKQVCEALDYAHNEARVVHRNLKPSNLMLDRRGLLKVTEFGIASSISDSMRRLNIQPVGSNDSLAYMSPQQAQGASASPLDDVYSLAATFYELLTGMPPYYSGQIHQQVLNDPPVPISQRRVELGIAGQSIPPEWEETILACLAKDPAHRPQSVAEVWARLNRKAAASVADPVAPVKSRKSKIWIAVVAAAIFVLLAAGSLGWRSGHAAPRRAEVTVLKATASAGDEARKHAKAERLRTEAEKAAGVELQSQAADHARLAEEQGQAGGVVAEKSTGQEKTTAVATKEDPFENSLGMKFVPVPGTGVSFSVWDTRVKDYRAFCDATAREWRKPDFAQTADDPAVMVNWEDAKAFCEWLTDKDRKAGRIRTDQEYRLPTDTAWSTAVGSGRYPWGNEWPPPKGAGNYDPSLGVDSYGKTSPCGTLSPNEFGLYDMGGNVWQWCSDWYRADMNEESMLEKYPGLRDDGGGEKYRVVRGGSWNGVGPDGLCASPRSYVSPAYRLSDSGFRCVLGSVSPVESR